jgi:hypothetical protein
LRVFDFVLTENIIVRNAGKPATLAWLKHMESEFTRVEFHLDRDPRLVSAVRAAARFQASRAGFETEGCENFAKASEDVCKEALTQLSDSDGGLNVTLDTYPDRMEICIQHRGLPVPAVGLDIFATSNDSASKSGGLNGAELLSSVDRISFNLEEGVACTRLVKFLWGKH